MRWKWKAWVFSFRRAWQNPAMRWLGVGTAVLTLCGCTFFVWKIVPLRGQGTAILHYNVYLGIDQVRSWWWALLLPLVWAALVAFDLLIAYGVYNKDSHLALGLAVTAFAWSIPWLFALYYLSRVNL